MGKQPDDTIDRDHMLLTYMNDVQTVLGLNHWTIRRSEHTPADEETAAMMDFTPAQYDAALRIGETFWDCEPSEQRYLICHELVHVHLRQSNDAMESTADALGVAAYSLLTKAYNNATEFATDALAKVIAQFIDLPPQFPLPGGK